MELLEYKIVVLCSLLFPLISTNGEKNLDFVIILKSLPNYSEKGVIKIASANIQFLQNKNCPVESQLVQI